jgi:hypothetical protein
MLTLCCPVSPSLPLLCSGLCHHIVIELFYKLFYLVKHKDTLTFYLHSLYPKWAYKRSLHPAECSAGLLQYINCITSSYEYQHLDRMDYNKVPKKKKLHFNQRVVGVGTHRRPLK